VIIAVKIGFPPFASKSLGDLSLSKGACGKGIDTLTLPSPIKSREREIYVLPPLAGGSQREGDREQYT